MIDAFSGILTILLLCVVGFFLKKRDVVTDEVMAFISKITAKVTIPCVMLVSAVDYLSPEMLRGMGIWLLFPFLLLLLFYLLARLLGVLFRLPVLDRGVFRNLFAHPNAISMGLPLIGAIIGEDGILFLIVYFFASAILFFGLTVNDIAKDAGHAQKEWRGKLKQIFSPALLLFAAGTIIRFLGIPFPAFLLSAARYLGNMTPPLMLILVGAVMAGVKDMVRLSRSAILALIGRILICPVLCLILCALLSAPPVTAKSYVIISGLPAMNQVMAMSHHYGANDKLVAQTLLSTVVLCAVTIPLLLLLFDSIY